MEIKDKQGHSYQVDLLSKEFADREWKQILDIGNRISGIEWSKEYLIADKDEYREYRGKWDHSLVVMNGQEVVAFLIAFEREPKGRVYKFPSFYIHFFAVKDSYQGRGIGKKLLELFFENCEKGFKHLEGKPVVTLQTNVADFNQKAKDFYRKFGFRKIGRKIYPNRTDWIMVRK